MAENSRTNQAVKRVLAGERVRDVARSLDLSESAVYTAVKREKEKQLCPCCKQIVRAGFEVDHSVLKAGK